MSRRTSRTRTVLIGAALVLSGVYLILVLITRHPLRSLAWELIGVVVLWAAYVVRFTSSDPRALLPEVLWFRLKDRWHPPPEGAVVFTGSSTIGHWTSLEEDMAPLPVLNRGINGAQLHQIDWLLDRLVLPYHPRAVVLYAGENDLAGFLGSEKKMPEEVLLAFQEFCEAIHAHQPDTSIHFIAIKPAKGRSQFIPAFEATNRLVQEYCASDPRLHFIDVAPALLGADGRPRDDVFEFDGIHLNEAGYRILASVVKPRLTVAQESH
jgi:lysophospholipase L1-like esterase